jgi:hypothetical protein
VTSITESTTKYTGTTGVQHQANEAFAVSVYPNPSSDFIAVQVAGLNTDDIKVEMFDITGKLVQKTTLRQGTTITYIDTRTLYAGSYVIKFTGTNGTTTQKVVISK